MDSASFAVSAGEALVASIGDMTSSSTNKFRDVSRKVTLARLLDEKSSSSSSSSSDKAKSSDDDKENSRTTTNSSGSGNAILSERCSSSSSSSSNNNNNSNDNSRNNSSCIGGGTTTLLANRGGLEALRDLRDLSSIVSEVERRAAALREAIESHRRDNIARREMSETTRQQTAQLAATLSALPEHLPHAATPPPPPPPTAAAATSQKTAAAAVAVAAAAAVPTAGGADSNAATVAYPVVRSAGGIRRGEADAAASGLTEVPVLELVTVGELNGVPRSTRARLTIEQVNSAVTEIQKAVERRHAFLSKPRKKMSEKQRGRLEELLRQEVPAHGGEPFIAEPDLRALPAFKKGEVREQLEGGAWRGHDDVRREGGVIKSQPTAPVYVAFRCILLHVL
ncbi:unnamed protein product [Pylaiella littoralis]